MAKEIKGIVRPPMEMPAELQGQRSQMAVRKSAKAEVPLLITLFAWYCFLRAGILVVFALIVGIAPESALAQLVANHFNPMPPPQPPAFAVHHPISMAPTIPPEAVFYGFAILYAIVGWRWLARDWRARWAAMFISGATAAKIVVDWIADRAAGNPAPMSPAQNQGILLAIVWNVLICCYLAFYPGMKEAFKETPWE